MAVAWTCTTAAAAATTSAHNWWSVNPGVTATHCTTTSIPPQAGSPFCGVSSIPIRLFPSPIGTGCRCGHGIRRRARICNFSRRKSGEVGKSLAHGWKDSGAGSEGFERPLSIRSSNEDLSIAEMEPDAFRNKKGAEEGVVCLVLGSGGREHSLCYALRRSASCAGVFCAPGNAGISSSGDATCVSKLNIQDSAAIAAFCKEWGVGLVVVGPEGPLVAGVVDDLIEAGVPTFGPSAAAAALEGSKTFMKRLCDKYHIPTARYGSFTSAEEAKKYIKQQELPIVVKADGLAAGKGVIIANTVQEALEAVDSMLMEGAFGSAGSVVVVEEFLDGEEVSFFAIVDGETALPLASAQDHKRVGDGDTGLNTGGMGAYSPAPVLTPELQTLVMESIISPTVKGMAAEGCRFVGVLYAGIIVETKSSLPKLLEYNVRFGDPECQVLMLRFQSDLVQVLLAACQGQLKGVELKWANDPALVVVMASTGYPGNYQKGSVIKNLEEADSFGPEVKLFHAGTALDQQENIMAVGGRVLGVTAMGKNIVDAQRKAYQLVDCINWPEGFCRRDIGWRAIARLNADELNSIEEIEEVEGSLANSEA